MKLKLISLALLLLLSLASTAHSATSTSVSVAMDDDAYSALDTLDGAAPVASIAVANGLGAPLAGVEVRVVFLRILPGVGYASNETVFVTTDAAGIATATAPQLSTLPGNYRVVAFAGGVSGSDTYAIGL